MGVRLKILLVIVLVAAGLVSILSLAFTSILSASLQNVERTSTQRAVQRMLTNITDESQQLGITVGDWAPWDDTYQFIADGNQDYVTANLATTSTIVNLQANLMLFVNNQGTIVWGKRVDLSSGQELPLPASINAELRPGRLLGQTDPHSVLSGLIVLPEGALLVAAAPIVTSEYQGPVRGAVVLGRFMDQAELDRLTERTQLPIHLYPLAQPLPADAARARAALAGAGPVFVQPLDQNIVAGYSLVNDIGGQPVLLLRVDNPRDGQAQAEASTRYFLVALIATVLVFTLATLILIDRTVIRRLAALNSSLTQIGVRADTSARVEVRGSDEIAALARGVNNMLAALQQSESTSRQAEEALRASEQRYALAAQGANDGLWDWDLVANTIHLSERWKAMLGCGPNDIGLQPSEWLSRVHPQDLPAFEAAIAAHLAGHTDQLNVEHRLRHSDGSYRWMLCRGLAVHGPDGAPARMAGSLTDINEQKLAEQRLMHEAMHDTLTGLANRALLLDRLALALARARRSPERTFAVLFLDLDRFKVVNDSLGHLAGDEMLIEVGRRLRNCARSQDTVARLGGDEFALLVEDVRLPEAGLPVANRIHAALAQPYSLRGQEVFTNVSIGIACYQPSYQFPEELLRDADIAMYQAKALGRARHVVFDAAQQPRAAAQLQLETDLRYALERSELRLHFQPIIALAQNQIVGFEALVRWEHPSLGLLAPREFIPLAEETGLIVPLGRWVIDTACRAACAWPANPPGGAPLVVNVNLSTKQFSSTSLVSDVQASLARSGLDPARLNLEITESALVEGGPAVETVLQHLADHGVHFALDDFGTGYSWLDYLRRFKISQIKIDRRFVAGLGAGDSDRAIVQSIMSLAHQLGLTVVGEGIETREQHERLLALGCEQGQGFLYSPPVPEAQVAALLAHTLVPQDAIPH
jgi:diguanylate cyclase (GGDEF)-like protein/PAS domain S-box-containing protein